MYQHMHMDPAAAQAAVDRSRANLDEQLGNQASMLSNHEGTRAGFFGMAGKAYEGSFVNNDSVMTTTGQDHGRIDEADQYSVHEYQVADDDNAAAFNMMVNPS